MDSEIRCFVIMPFGNPRVDENAARRFDRIYTQWIKPAVEETRLPNDPNVRFICHRADKVSRPGEIINHIVEQLVTSNIVIADLSGRNPNVFYELGVRHSVNNNTILISNKVEDIPFDLQGLRALCYEYDPESMLLLRNAIQQAIIEIMSAPDRIDNPIRQYLHNRETTRLLHQEASPGFDILKDMMSEMSQLRDDISRQSKEITRLMRVVTSELFTPSKETQAASVFETLEGTWRSALGTTTFFIRVTNGEVLIPYSYGNTARPTGHLYNLRIIEQTIFARFEWLGSSPKGYIMLDIKTDELLDGGWWYAEDVPEEIARDPTLIHTKLPRMNDIVLTRIDKSPSLPEWATEYFRRRDRT